MGFWIFPLFYHKELEPRVLSISRSGERLGSTNPGQNREEPGAFVQLAVSILDKNGAGPSYAPKDPSRPKKRHLPMEIDRSNLKSSKIPVEASPASFSPL